MKRYLVLFLLLGLGTLALLVAQTRHPLAPSEDAYITFRYARNLAEGHGIVWNVGEDPVEGGTEFLWTVLLAGTSRLTGLSIEAAARVMNLLIGLLAVWAMALAAWGLTQARLWPGLFATLAFAAGPLSYHVRAGFATPLFTLLILLMAVMAYLAVYGEPHARARRASLVGLPLAGLLLGLTRPEGVLFAGLTLVVTWFLLAPAARWRLVQTTLLLLIVPGAIYFVWRWHYFGYFLPNTFYVKNAGSWLHLRYFTDIYALFRFMAPLFLLIGFGMWRMPPQDALKKGFLLAPAILFPWSYLLIDQLQNLGKRFQYPVYPVFLLAAAMALAALGPRASLPSWRREHIPFYLAGSAALVFMLFAPFVVLERMTLIVVLVAVAAALRWADTRGLFQPPGLTLAAHGVALALVVFNTQAAYRLANSFYPTVFDDRKAIGEALAPFADKGYTLVASEAGWIPYFSRWRTVDPFGLNDEYVAHHGLDFAYLDRQHPAIIMYHQVKNPHPPRWADMVKLLRDYAQARGYILAAVIERKGPQDLHVYWVDPKNPDAAALIQAITSQDGFIYQQRATPFQEQSP